MITDIANDKIKGHLAKLSDDRLVFLGKKEGLENTWFLGFRNEKGEDTRITLSGEAMFMITELYHRRNKGKDIFPIKATWNLVVEEKQDDNR